MKKAITINRGDLFEDAATGYVYRVLGRRGRTSEFECECTDEYDEDLGEYINFESCIVTYANMQSLVGARIINIG